VSWWVLKRLGHAVRFATPTGLPAQADEIMLTGRGLDPWGLAPGLRDFVGVGRFLRADHNGRRAYREMVESPEHRRPLRWKDIRLADFDGLLLPGGHRARGMRPYLENGPLQAAVVEAFRRHLPVAAICHGVLLAARSIDPASGRSALYGRRTTALTWTLERRAWRLARVSRFWDPDYYRTYRESPAQPAGYMSVQQEVTRSLARIEDFCDVEAGTPDAAMKASGRVRDRMNDDRPACCRGWQLLVGSMAWRRPHLRQALRCCPRGGFAPQPEPRRRAPTSAVSGHVTWSHLGGPAGCRPETAIIPCH
jgi:putative intracellular protease/amidase